MLFWLLFERFKLWYIIIWTMSAILPHTSWCFRIIITVFFQIIHWFHNIYIFCIVYLNIIYTTYTISKWYAIFKYYYFISLVCSFCIIIISTSSNCYNSTNKCVCITLMTQIWLYNRSFKFNDTTIKIFLWFIIYFNQISCFTFRCLFCCIIL